jgi:microcystin-dependent protein
MAPQPPQPDTRSVFQSSLRDGSGQPNIIINSAQSNELIWALANPGTGQDLVVTPFGSGPVGPGQYHFRLTFAPGALTGAPTLEDWDIAVQEDSKGGIQNLFIALSGSSPVTVAPSHSYSSTLTYKNAIQEDSNNSKLAVTLTAGGNVTIGGTPIERKSFGPFSLNLVPPNIPPQSAPPLAVDFVGRRTVLNDGQTPNIFTFALTNMTQADLALTPYAADAKASHTVLTVWFDAAPNQPDQPYPWALAKVEDLTDPDVKLTPPSTDWNVPPPVAARAAIAGNPQWAITVSKAVVLRQQEPVLFQFKGIKTDLAPGVTRMYLRYENLPGFATGLLIAELEKSPLMYGDVQGDGLYLSAGVPQGNTPPAPTFKSGLHVVQFGNAPVATFSGGGSGAADTVVQLSNTSTGGKTWEIVSCGDTGPAQAGRLLIRDSNHFVVGLRNASDNDRKYMIQIGSGESTITDKRVDVIIATENADAGIAIAQKQTDNSPPVNLLLQASGFGGYIGTQSEHPLVFRTGGDDRMVIDKDGTVNARNRFVGEGAFVTGMIVMWSGALDKVPTGWALCNGALLPEGWTLGDGTTNAPDLSGKFIVGYQATDDDYKKIGNTGGAKTVTLSKDQLPQHNHPNSTTDAVKVKTNFPYGEGWGDASQELAKVHNDGTVDIESYDHSHNLIIAEDGGGQAHENRPPYFTLAYIIKIEQKPAANAAAPDSIPGTSRKGQ